MQRGKLFQYLLVKLLVSALIDLVLGSYLLIVLYHTLTKYHPCAIN